MQIISFAKERKLRKFISSTDEWEVKYYLDIVKKELEIRENFGCRSAAGKKKHRQVCSTFKRTGWMLFVMVVLFLMIGFLTTYGGMRLAHDVFVIKNVSVVSSFVKSVAMVIFFGMTLSCITGAYTFLCGSLRYIRLGTIMLKVPKEDKDALIVLKSRLEKALRGYENGKTI